jgi:hypothetical protein
MWRYENFFRLARELRNKGANSLIISLSSISDTLGSIQAQISSTKPTTPRKSMVVQRRSLPINASRIGAILTPRPLFVFGKS